MNKKSVPLAQNKLLGHILAFAFYIGLGYFLFVAASNMNYVWKWNSIPKYFTYIETINVEAPVDGKFVLEDGQYAVLSYDENKEVLNITNEYTLEINTGEEIYEGDVLASISQRKLGPVLIGLWVTLKISFFSALLTFVIGVTLAFMRLSHIQAFKDIASVYIAVIRGTPLLVQIFLFYFIVANLFELDRFTAGVFSLGIFFGAYMAEVLRGAIQSIDKGQMEAANSLGISYFNTMRHIILPQAFKRALPTLVGEMIALVKDSSLVSVIAITDLTKVGKEIVANTFSPFETWIVIALVYLSITFTMTYFGHRLEQNMNSKGGMS
ncbi:amino acid ABC transporter permease [Sulfurimonas sp.]|uniref:amino acid ABC transporter permease n=1 Tax=Sulfurimonas sp. TaxID=2022749 RepID=UPI0025E9BF59|nr:amino acid ABC transporter permease [Sulfurimonas sp.]